jgi:hypothetical protein
VCLDQFPIYVMNILLDVLNAKLDKEDICKQTIRNECSHEICNDNGVRVIKFATSKNLFAVVLCPLVAIFINAPGLLLRERRATRVTTFRYTGDSIQLHLMSGISEGLIVVLTTLW